MMRKQKSSKYLTAPTRPIQIDRDRSVAGILQKMEGAGFQARTQADFLFDQEPLRRRGRVDRRKSFPRSTRDTGPLPLPGAARRDRRGTSRGSGGPILRYAGERA